MLLPLFLLAFLIYLLFVLSTKPRAVADAEPEAFQLSLRGKGLLAGIVPALISVVMTSIFVIQRAATTVQFNAGSDAHMNAWSTWVDLWPLFLLLSLLNGIFSLIWMIASLLRKAERRSHGMAFASLALSTLALFTVASYFPSA